MGERFSLVFFTIGQYIAVPLDQRIHLPDYTDEKTLRMFHRMLAPPRGYVGSCVQQSIWRAFGYKEKDQALRWTIHTTNALPKDVLLQISRYSGMGIKRLSRRFAAALKED